MSEQDHAPLIPDSIEPYRGYKALSTDRVGALWSPSKGIQWPAKQRLEAICSGDRFPPWGWVPLEGEPRKAVSVADYKRRPPKPNNPLPDGWSWSWEPLTHDAPDEACHCGIYVVDDPERCLSYMKPDGIIAEIALWGKVIPAENGARGQYAYPSRLLAPRQILGELRMTSLLYGIPMLVLDEPIEEKEDEEILPVPVSGVGQAMSHLHINVATPGEGKLLRSVIDDMMTVAIQELEKAAELLGKKKKP